MEHAAEMEVACPNCGAVVGQTFCPACGQKRIAEHDKSLGHLFHEIFHEIVHLDGRLWWTLKALLGRPGLLTAEYWAGRRGKMIGPFRLFLTCIALNYLALSNGPVNMQFLERQNEGGAVFRRQVEKAAARRGQPVASIEGEASRLMQKTYSLGQYLVPLAMGGLLWLFWRRQTPYYTDHLIAAVHGFSFFFLLGAVATPIGMWLSKGGSTQSAYVTMPLTLLYWTLTVRRLYGQSLGNFFRGLAVWAFGYLLLFATISAGVLLALMLLL